MAFDETKGGKVNRKASQEGSSKAPLDLPWGHQKEGSLYPSQRKATRKQDIAHHRGLRKGFHASYRFQSQAGRIPTHKVFDKAVRISHVADVINAGKCSTDLLG